MSVQPHRLHLYIPTNWLVYNWYTLCTTATTDAKPPQVVTIPTYPQFNMVSLQSTLPMLMHTVEFAMCNCRWRKHCAHQQSLAYRHRAMLLLSTARYITPSTNKHAMHSNIRACGQLHYAALWILHLRSHTGTYFEYSCNSSQETQCESTH